MVILCKYKYKQLFFKKNINTINYSKKIMKTPQICVTKLIIFHLPPLISDLFFLSVGSDLRFSKEYIYI